LTSKVRPSRLINDPTREAVNSLRGYVYQIWQSLLAWTQLTENDALFLEGAEDADVFRADEVVATQIRISAQALTLNSQLVRDALLHYWEHVARNSDRTVRYRYITTASIGHEQVGELGFGRPGLELWKDAQRLETRAEWKPLVNALKQHLMTDTAVAPAIRGFLEQASIEEVRVRLILPVIWDVNAPNQEDIVAGVSRAISSLGHEQNLTRSQARMAIPTLLQRVLEKVTTHDDRWLDREDLLDAFETATSVPEDANATRGGCARPPPTVAAALLSQVENRQRNSAPVD
jgi:hypothetical protein